MTSQRAKLDSRRDRRFVSHSLQRAARDASSDLIDPHMAPLNETPEDGDGTRELLTDPPRVSARARSPPRRAPPAPPFTGPSLTSPRARPSQPLAWSGKFAGGLIADVRRRAPHYVSDWTDAFLRQPRPMPLRRRFSSRASRPPSRSARSSPSTRGTSWSHGDDFVERDIGRGVRVPVGAAAVRSRRHRCVHASPGSGKRRFGFPSPRRSLTV